MTGPPSRGSTVALRGPPVASQGPPVAHGGAGSPVVWGGARQQSFGDLVRLLAEVHEQEVSALKAKISELEQIAALGMAETAGFRHAPSRLSSRTSCGTQGSHPDGLLHSVIEAAGASTPASLGTPSQQLKSSRFRRAAKHARWLVEWKGFDISVGIIIFVNAVLIGVDLHLAVQERDRGMMNVLESVFLGIYTVEFALRALAYGRRCFDDNYVKFDALLLLVGWSSELLRELGSAIEGLGQLIVVRILRFMRFVRVFKAARMAGRWKPLWKLVSGIAGSMETLISTTVILAFAVYIFTCLSMELISLDRTLQEDPRTKDTIQEYFDSFAGTVMTTVQFVLMDSVGVISRPLIQVRWWLAFYFPVIFTILPILLMNLVTAVLVDDAISSSNMDEEMKRQETRQRAKALVPELRKAFQFLDADGSGQVQRQEILDADYSEMPSLEDIAHLLTRYKLQEFFDIFDEDDSGGISEREFVHGVMRLVFSESLSETSVEVAEVKHLALANMKIVRDVKAGLEMLMKQHEGGMPFVQSAPHSEAMLHPGASG